MRGVIREDDLKADKYTTALRPDADPWGDQDRPINHFYDPVTNESGTPLGGIFTQRSLNWAMGEANPLQPASVPDPSRGNHFSYMDARRNFFLALTYKTTGTTSATLTTTDSLIRQNLWASTMLSMGHVVHLLQDQASPQHARAEAHNYVCRGFFSLFNAPEATRTYENFINYRVIRLNFGRVGNPPSGYTATNLCEEKGWQKAFADSGQIDPPLIASWLRTGGGNTYPVPQFSVQRKFFTTRENDASGISTPIPMLNMRAGLGDYSNRGFYTEGKMAGSGNHAFISPPRLTSDPSFTDGVFKEVIVPGKGKVKSKGLLWQVPDAVAPGYPDTGLTGGKAPIVSYGQWGFFGTLGVKRRILTLDNYNQMADMLAPRAVAYTTGLINFFFRGKLEIEPITQRVFGVLNQGEPHTVNADGYPTRTSNGKIFGFEKIRLKIRNSTDVITESGTNQTVPQVVGMGKLVAVARYHRNPCYKPDLSGERVVGFVVPPLAATITEPACPQGLRTNYQEISVSAPLQINSAADLPGGSGGTPPATVEKLFDFSADPIPVNATDLFIQVVYRGQLGDETDGIAVGNVDVQEPTFTGAWNNTDYFYSDLSQLWFAANGAVPAKGIEPFNICTGSALNSVLVFSYGATDGVGGLQFFLPTLAPGIARLAFINSKQATASSQNAYRVTPQVQNPVTPPPSLLPRSYFSKGQQRQASREIYTPADPLPAASYCQAFPPTAGSNVWCFDPIQRRRGQLMGDAITPIFYNSQTGVANASDVDAPPAQPVFPGLRPRDGGTVLFDVDSPLLPCPNQLPAAQGKRLELIEAAMELGVDPKTLELEE